MVKPRNDFWSIWSNFIYRLHVEPRVYWNVDGDRQLSDDRFHKIHCSKCKTTGWIYMVLGRDWQGNKRPQDQTLCGQRFGKICRKRRNAKKSKSGQSRHQSSTMPGDCVVFTSLILMMENSRISWKMLVECWNFRCQPQCHANFNLTSTGETCRKIEEHKTKYACLVEVNESTRERLEGTLHKNHEDHMQGRETTHRTMAILHTN